jgi:hypothetical protein
MEFLWYSQIVHLAIRESCTKSGIVEKISTENCDSQEEIG